MKNILLTICVGMLCVSFKHSDKKAHSSTVSSPEPAPSPRLLPEAYNIYVSASLEAAGLSFDAFNYAWTGYSRLLEKGQLENTRYLTICDFSQSSRNKRFYTVDIEEYKMVTNTYVAHGRNSGGEYATTFSNRHESLQSSLGFYVTGNTYIGAHGLSLRLVGVDGKFNNQAFDRTIVIHGADYVDESRVRAGGYMGRSWGCPSLPKNESTSIINIIKDGTCLFIFHPIKTYLDGSKLLND